MFTSRFKRHAAQFAISAALAVVTPAAAAGLVEGVSVAATTVDQAASSPTIASDDNVAPTAAPQPSLVQTATHEPTPLNHLNTAPIGAKPVLTPHVRKVTP
jgi:hypothetical protein